MPTLPVVVLQTRTNIDVLELPQAAEIEGTVSTFSAGCIGSIGPDWITIDFAMPVLFLSLVGPMLKTRAHLAAAVTSIVAALAFGFLPSGTGLLVAAFTAMAVGAEIERRVGR